jgi:hypothetical protein
LREATAKLEKLKALQYYDVDTALHVLMAEVDVNVLRGDFEEVCLSDSKLSLGARSCNAEIPQTKQSGRRRRREVVSHAIARKITHGKHPT